MAVLTTGERQEVWRGVMRYWSSLRELIAVLSKDDLLGAVNATDTWINDNAASYVAALPAAAQTNLSGTQKTVLFCAVALRRVSKAFAKAVFGEVD